MLTLSCYNANSVATGGTSGAASGDQVGIRIAHPFSVFIITAIIHTTNTFTTIIVIGDIFNTLSIIIGIIFALLQQI